MSTQRPKLTKEYKEEHKVYDDNIHDVDLSGVDLSEFFNTYPPITFNFTNCTFDENTIFPDKVFSINIENCNGSLNLATKCESAANTKINNGTFETLDIRNFDVKKGIEIFGCIIEKLNAEGFKQQDNTQGLIIIGSEVDHLDLTEAALNHPKIISSEIDVLNAPKANLENLLLKQANIKTANLYQTAVLSLQMHESHFDMADLTETVFRSNGTHPSTMTMSTIKNATLNKTIFENLTIQQSEIKGETIGPVLFVRMAEAPGSNLQGLEGDAAWFNFPLTHSGAPCLKGATLSSGMTRALDQQRHTLRTQERHQAEVDALSDGHIVEPTPQIKAATDGYLSRLLKEGTVNHPVQR